jgi:hypothetical protein
VRERLDQDPFLPFLPSEIVTLRIERNLLVDIRVDASSQHRRMVVDLLQDSTLQVEVYLQVVHVSSYS